MSAQSPDPRTKLKTQSPNPTSTAQIRGPEPTVKIPIQVHPSSGMCPLIASRDRTPGMVLAKPGLRAARKVMARLKITVELALFDLAKIGQREAADLESENPAGGDFCPP